MVLISSSTLHGSVLQKGHHAVLDVIPPVIVLRLFCSREVLRFIVIYIECVLSDIDVCGVCCLFAGYNKQLLHPPVPSLTPPPTPPGTTDAETKVYSASREKICGGKRRYALLKFLSPRNKISPSSSTSPSSLSLCLRLGCFSRVKTRMQLEIELRIPARRTNQQTN